MQIPSQGHKCHLFFQIQFGLRILFVFQVEYYILTSNLKHNEKISFAENRFDSPNKSWIFQRELELKHMSIDKERCFGSHIVVIKIIFFLKKTDFGVIKTQNLFVILFLMLKRRKWEQQIVDFCHQICF